MTGLGQLLLQTRQQFKCLRKTEVPFLYPASSMTNNSHVARAVPYHSTHAKSFRERVNFCKKHLHIYIIHTPDWVCVEDHWLLQNNYNTLSFRLKIRCPTSLPPKERITYLYSRTFWDAPSVCMSANTTRSILVHEDQKKLPALIQT